MLSTRTKLFNRRKAREWYYRKMASLGRTVKPHRKYPVLPLTQKEALKELYAKMDRRALE